jgi:hypothetical protein
MRAAKASSSPWRTARIPRRRPRQASQRTSARPRPGPALPQDEARRLAVSCALADARAALERARLRALAAGCTAPAARAIVTFEIELLELGTRLLAEVR